MLTQLLLACLVIAIVGVVVMIGATRLWARPFAKSLKAEGPSTRLVGLATYCYQ
jgi:hypothetical protein